MAEIQPKPGIEQYDERIISYFKAGYPLLYMVTAEEARAEAMIAASAVHPGPSGKPRSGKVNLCVWSATSGLTCPGMPNDSKFNIPLLVAPDKALAHIKSSKEKGIIYIFRDLHAFFPTAVGIHVIRYLRDLYKEFQQLGSTLIVLSPVARLPLELQRDFTQIDFTLPDKKQISDIFTRLYTGNKEALIAKNLDPTDDDRERIVDAAMGLTSQEATNAFSMAMVDAVGGRGQIAKLVLHEKAQAVKKSGLLEYYHTIEDENSIGGLENLKTWLRRRALAFTAKAKVFGLPPAKGVLLVGIPGGGKSLAAKVTAAIMQVPLIKFDIAKVFAGLVGQSEENMRTALQTIDAIGPCVVWLDEMEKAFAGASGSGSGDNGVTRRVFGNFLTWMADKTTPSFVAATANSIIGIPPELLRKGRFDENFYVGLPDNIARGEIFKIHLRRFKRQDLKINIPKLVDVTKKFTGAEIEAVISEGLFTAFDKNRDLTTEDMIESAAATHPIVDSQRDEINAMTEWAKNNALNASKHNEESEGETVGRQLVLS